MGIMAKPMPTNTETRSGNLRIVGKIDDKPAKLKRENTNNVTEEANTRRILSTLVFLALISIPIAGAFADGVWIPTPGVYVPKSLPSAEPDASDNVTVASPLATDVWLYSTMPNERFDQSGHEVGLGSFSFTQTGHYDLTVHFAIRNPSTKWTYALLLGQPDAYDSPAGAINSNTWKATPYTADNYFYPIATCRYNTYPAYYEVEKAVLSMDVVSAGQLTFRQTGCQLRTDVNHDNVVNILDISAVVHHYGEDYGATTQLYDYNVVVDTVISIMDLKAVAYEFGRTIPP